VFLPLFFPEGGVGLVPKRGCLLTLAFTHSPDDMSLESDGGTIYSQVKTEEIREKPVPVPHCPPQIPHGLVPGTNPGLRRERPATNDLSHGTALLAFTLVELSCRDDLNF
jgi:hypothetical protein